MAVVRRQTHGCISCTRACRVRATSVELTTTGRGTTIPLNASWNALGVPGHRFMDSFLTTGADNASSAQQAPSCHLVQFAGAYGEPCPPPVGAPFTWHKKHPGMWALRVNRGRCLWRKSPPQAPFLAKSGCSTCPRRCRAGNPRGVPHLQHGECGACTDDRLRYFPCFTTTGRRDLEVHGRSPHARTTRMVVDDGSCLYTDAGGTASIQGPRCCDDVDPCVGQYDECGVCNGRHLDRDCDGNVLDAFGECGGACAADDDGDGVCDDVDPCVGALDTCGVLVRCTNAVARPWSIATATNWMRWANAVVTALPTPMATGCATSTKWWGVWRLWRATSTPSPRTAIPICACAVHPMQLWRRTAAGWCWPTTTIWTACATPMKWKGAKTRRATTTPWPRTRFPANTPLGATSVLEEPWAQGS